MILVRAVSHRTVYTLPDFSSVNLTRFCYEAAITKIIKKLYGIFKLYSTMFTVGMIPASFCKYKVYLFCSMSYLFSANSSRRLSISRRCLSISNLSFSKDSLSVSILISLLLQSSWSVVVLCLVFFLFLQDVVCCNEYTDDTASVMLK